MIWLLVAQLAFPTIVVRTDITDAQLCTIKWGRDTRHVTVAMKRKAAQGLPQAQWGRVIFDHVIPRQLGGADRAENLRVQTKAASRRKDVVENRLHREYCAGQIDLKAARAALWNWR